jgi:hypothetical protein
VPQQVGQPQYQQYPGPFFQYPQPAITPPPPQFVNQHQGNPQAAAKKRKKKNLTAPVQGQLCVASASG